MSKVDKFASNQSRVRTTYGDSINNIGKPVASGSIPIHSQLAISL